MDRMSQLPDSILQHILFFLPAKDTAQSSVLSKTWLNVWNSIPEFTFDFDENRFLQEHASAKTEELQQGDEKYAFLIDIDRSLAILRIQKAIIEKLRLSLKLLDLESASLIDEWIGLATNNCIRELDVNFMCMGINDWQLPCKNDDEGWYILPSTAFAAKSLEVLRVAGCKLQWPLNVDHIKLTNLRELSLTYVLLDETIIAEIISACPMLEDLSLIRCKGVKDLFISDLPKLLKLTLRQVAERTHLFRSIWIQAVSLQSLHYRGSNGELMFDLTAFKLLKELIISYEQITDRMVENVVSQLPLLEKLEFNFCFRLTRLKFSSRVLRHLAFCAGKTLIEVVIDAPNLLYFHYGAFEFPAIFSMATSSLQESYLTLKPDCHLSTTWFQNLRGHISRFERLNLLTLYISSMTNAFVAEELNGSSSSSVVKHLKIHLFHPSLNHLNYESLLDGLLWTCHPEILSVDNVEDHDFIQFLREKLMERELLPVCCVSGRIKCWRHYLKDVEVEISTSQPDHISSTYRDTTTSFKLRW